MSITRMTDLDLAGKREETLKADVAAGVARETGLKGTIATLEKAQMDLNAALEARTKQLDDAKKQEDSLKAELNKSMEALTQANRRETMLKGAGFPAIVGDLWPLGIILAVLTGLALLRFRRTLD